MPITYNPSEAILAFNYRHCPTHAIGIPDSNERRCNYYGGSLRAIKLVAYWKYQMFISGCRRRRHILYKEITVYVSI